MLLLLGQFIDDETRPALESQAADGTSRRIDIEYGSLVVECKKRVDPSKQQELGKAEKQLAGYLAVRQSQTKGLYAGILTDGHRWRHYRLSPKEKLSLVSELLVDKGVTNDRPFRDWLGSALPTEPKVVPIAETIAARLGADSPAHNITIARLTDLLESGADVPEVVLKRELWKKLLRTAFGTQFEGTDTLFVEHTYLVVLSIMIARVALGLSGNQPAARMLSGEEFAENGITGVGEAAFFDWMLGVDGGDEIVADIALRASPFNWSQTGHDVLKVLYQSVMAQKERHGLGEYYTPDWLADRMVRTVVGDPLSQRVLDPGCGSGTFLFAAIVFYFEAAAAAGVATSQAVDELPAHIFGIDLHPVAVTLAQVTYLLAVGFDRLAQRQRPFAVPIYLGDSMRWEDTETGATETLLHDSGDVVVETSDGAELFPTTLRFPANVVARPDFDALVSELVERASNRKPGGSRPSIKSILNKYSQQNDRDTLEKTYDLLCTLHDAGRDHIWGYFVRNQAKPAWFAQKENRVDVLVGNPPWLSYRFMPSALQKRFKERSQARGLWKGGARGVTTQQDLSAFFAVRSIELYLADSGRFAFVVPLAVLSRQSYEGFRSARWSASGELTLGAKFDTPWSLREIKPSPFLVPSAVVLGERSWSQAVTALPAEVENLAGKVTRVAPWMEVAGSLTITKKAIAVVAADFDHGSPYGDSFRAGAVLFPRVLITVEDRPRDPLLTAHQKSVQSRRSSQEKEPWKSLPALSGGVEEQFVRPMLLGESIVPFRLVSPVEAVIPYSKSTGLMSGDSVDIDRYPGLASWWRKAESLYVDHRASDKRALIDQLNYMKQLTAQFPIADVRVVYSASGNTLAAAIITDANAIIEHSLYWAAVSSVPEGRYLTAILNAPVLTELVEPYQSIGDFGPRHFDKYVWRLPIPSYDSQNPLHQQLADLAVRAEAEAGQVTCSAGFQKHRRLVREAVAKAGIAEELNQTVTKLIS